MKYSICNETFQGWDWDRTCNYVASVGYDGIEIAPFTLAEDVRTLDDAARRNIRAIAEGAGLEIVGLHWLLVSPKGMSLTSNDASLRAETSAYLEELVGLCADLGGRIMVLGSPQQRRIPEGGSRELAAERFCEGILPALDAAQERGIVLCLEPLPPPEADFLLTLGDARELMNRLQHPAARTIYDVKSATSEGIDMATLIREYRSEIAHVHANDANRRGPGFGETDFGPLLSALKETAYEGYVSIEVFDYSPDPETIATRSLEYLLEKAC